MGGTVALKYYDSINCETPEEAAELLALRAAIHPEGKDTTLTLHTSTGQINLTARIEHLTKIDAELRSASLLMQYRQTQALDEGEGALQDMLTTACEPAAVSVVADSKTGDKTFVLQFRDRLPIVIRLSAEHLNAILKEIQRESMRAAN